MQSEVNAVSPARHTSSGAAVAAISRLLAGMAENPSDHTGNHTGLTTLMLGKPPGIKQFGELSDSPTLSASSVSILRPVFGELRWFAATTAVRRESE